MHLLAFFSDWSSDRMSQWIPRFDSAALERPNLWSQDSSKLPLCRYQPRRRRWILAGWSVWGYLRHMYMLNSGTAASICLSKVCVPFTTVWNSRPLRYHLTAFRIYLYYPELDLSVYWYILAAIFSRRLPKKWNILLWNSWSTSLIVSV